MAAVAQSLRRAAAKWCKVLVYGLQSGCLVYCTLEFVGDFVICSGPSMEPTIFSNDIILTEHITVLRQKIETGDIVVCRSPINPRQYICKRVVGLPGDKIQRGIFSEVVNFIVCRLYPKVMCGLKVTTKQTQQILEPMDLYR
ncbi:mitochondrial inner membrane protease subunit 1 isoform X2 [Tachypleus tridentatus]|uniref:mitochondrial inner membrane protease subunit 1 isoform X2 n=1 Tax=Tachypleus tridentatus TaxID=6853 RepID=UPI003FD49E27